MSVTAVIVITILVIVMLVVLLAPLGEREKSRIAEDTVERSSHEEIEPVVGEDVELDLESMANARFLVLEEEPGVGQEGYTPTISAQIQEFSSELSASENHMDAPVAVFDTPAEPEAEPTVAAGGSPGDSNEVPPHIRSAANRSPIEKTPAALGSLEESDPATTSEYDPQYMKEWDESREVETMVDITINNTDGAARSIVSGVLEESEGAPEEMPPHVRSAASRRTMESSAYAEDASEAYYDDPLDTGFEGSSMELDRKMVVAGKGRAKAIYRVSPTGNATYMSTRVKPGVDMARVPAMVSIGNRELKVDGIAKHAFAGRAELKAVTIEAERLSRYSIRGCFRGSQISTVLVPEDKRFLYRHVFTREVTGSAKKLKVKSIQTANDNREG